MRLDPGIETFLETLRAATGGKPAPFEAEARRRMLRQRTALFPVALPSGVTFEDWHLALSGREIPLRIYRPAGGGKLAALLYFHGGGWVAGDPITHHATTAILAGLSGAVVVSVHYRRPPENPYPAALQDAEAVLEWLRDPPDWLDTDPGRIAAAGDSAGGNLTAALTLKLRDAGQPQLRHQLLIYPVLDTDFENASYRAAADPVLTPAAMRYYWNAYLSREADWRDPYAVPARAKDLTGLPPATLLTAEADPLRDEGEAYAVRLEAAGVPTTLLRGASMVHGFLRAWELSPAVRGLFEQACTKLVRDLA
ncbi:MAG: alpha/beta hydrolase [Rhodovibrionaceae bacterium]